MAKRKKEEPQKASAEWMNTFADLMNLLLCFFVLLFAMSTVDAQKFEMIAASFSQTFSIFSGGQTSIGEGMLLGNGVSQLNDLDQYMNSMGKPAESATDTDEVDEIDEMQEKIEEAQLAESEKLAERIDDAQFITNGIAHDWKTYAPLVGFPFPRTTYNHLMKVVDSGAKNFTLRFAVISLFN